MVIQSFQKEEPLNKNNILYKYAFKLKEKSYQNMWLEYHDINECNTNLPRQPTDGGTSPGLRKWLS